jgi:phospho-N-acetylmuramoyl-pentapeptide-transferase
MSKGGCLASFWQPFWLHGMLEGILVYSALLEAFFMLYHLSLYLKNYVHAFNVIHYVSFRVMLSLLTSLFFSFLFGSRFIAFSKKFFSAKSREHTPEGHRAKDGLPTMGGIFVVAIVIATVLLWGNLVKGQILLCLLCLVSFGSIGLWDDWSKIKYKRGITERHKFWLQIVAGLMVASLWFWFCSPSTRLCFPFFKNYCPDLGIFFIPWVVFLLVGTSNAVNLTDGLDGLAIGSLISNFATYSLIAYVAGHWAFASYLHIPFAGTAELAVVGAALVGASLGFLWYNTYPAQIFMGDVGALALGSVLALMALMARQELLLVISGGLFVIETLSVILQVYAYKRWGKRIFKMAPIHHHFELLGWPEAKITVRFGIISLILCLIALMTLKLR